MAYTLAARRRDGKQEEPEGKLGQLIGQLQERVDSGDTVSISLLQRIAGSRAAGPLLLLPALIMMSPLSAIPGLPTLVGVNTILIAGQITFGRDRVWLPKWLTDREISPKRAEKLLRFLAPAGRIADKVAKPRAEAGAGPLFRRVGAGVCVVVGCVMPLLEIIPFTSTWAACIVAVYALAVTAKDGFLALAWTSLVIAAACLAWVMLT